MPPEGAARRIRGVRLWTAPRDSAARLSRAAGCCAASQRTRNLGTLSPQGSLPCRCPRRVPACRAPRPARPRRRAERGAARVGMPALREKAARVVRRLREEGFEAYFAGGCVRDRLLGREPEDYDIATSAPPATVQKLFSHTVPIGIQFGVVLVLDDGAPFEVATFRSDGAYIDGRHPTEVHFGTAEADARRRDFTINGLFLDPLGDRVIDYVGGQEDLRAGIVRAIGDPAARFREDRLRTIRAVRFAARFGFEIEARTDRKSVV